MFFMVCSSSQGLISCNVSYKNAKSVKVLPLQQLAFTFMTDLKNEIVKMQHDLCLLCVVVYDLVSEMGDYYLRSIWTILLVVLYSRKRSVAMNFFWWRAIEEHTDYGLFGRYAFQWAGRDVV